MHHRGVTTGTMGRHRMAAVVHIRSAGKLWFYALEMQEMKQIASLARASKNRLAASRSLSGWVDTW